MPLRPATPANTIGGLVRVGSGGGGGGSVSASTDTTSVTISGTSLTLTVAAANSVAILAPDALAITTVGADASYSLTLTANACTSLTLTAIGTINFTGGALATLVVPVGVTAVTLTCSGLTSLTLPAGLTSFTLTGATGLTGITLGAVDAAMTVFNCGAGLNAAGASAILASLDGVLVNGTTAVITLTGAAPTTDVAAVQTIDFSTWDGSAGSVSLDGPFSATWLDSTPGLLPGGDGSVITFAGSGWNIGFSGTVLTVTCVTTGSGHTSDTTNTHGATCVFKDASNAAKASLIAKGATVTTG